MLRGEIVRLASNYGRDGYRRVTALLRVEGWKVNHKRVGADMERGGIKSSRETTKKGKALPERWFVHQASPLLGEPCLEL